MDINKWRELVITLAIAITTSLSVTSFSASAGLITNDDCNMLSINNPNYGMCMNLDADNNRFSFDVTSTGNDKNYRVGFFNFSDLENSDFLMDNSRIDYDLSSLGDVFRPLRAGGYTASDISFDDHLKLVLNISEELTNEIVSGRGFNFTNYFVDSQGDLTEIISGEAFYKSSISVDEGMTPLGGILLGLGLMLGANILNNSKKSTLGFSSPVSA